MDFNNLSTQKQFKQNPSKPNNKRLTLDQARLLEAGFKSNPKLRPESKLELAAKLGMSPRQVAIWYQNRRARHKTETIELDYRTIQLQLDNVMVEKRKLEKEVGMLRHELNKAQQMLHEPNLSAASLPSGSASGNGEHGSSSSISNDYGLESASAFQVEDLYTCLSYWP